jgi:transposase
VTTLWRLRRQAPAQDLGRWGLSGAVALGWVDPLKRTHKVDLAVVERPGKGFQVVKQRWKVERTFAWRLNARRHSRDSEAFTASSEAMIQSSMIRLLLKRLA